MTERCPTMRALGRTLALVSVVVATSVLRAAEPIALPAESRILDPDILLEEAPVVSPDGRWVAYFSKGWICIANVASGDMRRIIEVKETRSFALDRLRHARDVPSDELNRYAEVDKYATHDIFDLQWMDDSEAIVFGVSSPDIANDASVTDVWLARPDGSKEQIVHIGDNKLVRSAWPPGIKLSRNRKFLVFTHHHPRPLIWSIDTEMPRATPYLAMTPSSTSERWLAVEKDTRQIVVLDENFDVAERIDEFVSKPPYSNHTELHWSPDERHVIWQIQIGFDHYSNWEGCRLDLKTKQRRILTGSYMKEEIRFTGRGGEFLRVGAEGIQGMRSGLITTSVYLQVVPPGSGFVQTLWSKRAAPFGDMQAADRLGGIPPVVCSPNFDLFVIGLPREEGPYGVTFHLLNRERRLWRLTPEDNGRHHTPFDVIGFAEGGETLIGCDETRLFAIPIAAIQTPENDVRAGAEAERRAAAAAARKAAELRKLAPRSAQPGARR